MSESLSLNKKIVKIMSEASAIGKGGYNSRQEYKYTEAEDVIREVRQLMVSYNLRLKSEVIERKREEISSKTKMTVLTIRYTIVDSESGEMDSSTITAEGMDSGDKGNNKAMTAGLKYFFRDTFLLEFADDPEKEEQQPIQQKNQYQQQNKNQQTQQSQQQTTKTTTQQQKNQNQQQPGPQKLISEKQRGKLIAEGNKRGLNDDWQRAWSITFYNKDSRTKLTSTEASKMIDDFIKLDDVQLKKKTEKVKEHMKKLNGGAA